MNVRALSALLDPLAHEMPPPGGPVLPEAGPCGACGAVCEEWVEEGEGEGALPAEEDEWVGLLRGEDDIDSRTGVYLRVLEWVALM